MLRLREDLRIKTHEKVENLEDYKGKNTAFDAQFVSWEEEYHFEIKTENGSTWFLLRPLGSKNGAQKHEQRFSIEKCFQYQKSSGFDMEKSKIRKYDRFKRLYFSMCLSQLLMVIVGEYVESENHPLKKHFLQPQASAFSDLDSYYSNIILRK